MSSSKKSSWVRDVAEAGKRERQHEQEHEPAPPDLSTEDKLLRAIMAKMSTLTTTTEERRRPPGEILRPVGMGGRASTSSPPTRFENPLSDKLNRPTRIDYLIPRTAIQGITELLIGTGRRGGNLEVEASFGIFDTGKFRPGLRSHSDFINLREFLEHSHEPRFRSTPINDVIELMSGNIRRHYDVEYPDAVLFERKSRHTKTATSIYSIGVRVTRSNEVEVDPVIIWEPTMRRRRRRLQFVTSDTRSPYYGFSIDLTIVQEESLSWDGGEESVDRIITKYEVEIEARKKVNAKNFGKTIEFVYRASIANFAPVIKPDTALFTLADREYCVKLNNTLFEGDIRAAKNRWTSKDPYRLFSHTFWNKPKNVKIRNLQPTEDKRGHMVFHLERAATTIKLDGRRQFLLVARDVCWMVMPPYAIARYAMLTDAGFDGSYLDGEFVAKLGDKGKVVDYTYHVFDVLFYKGRDVRGENFSARLSMATDVVKHVEPFYGKCVMKKFYTEGTIWDRMRAAADEYELKKKADAHSVDGIIIQPGHWYRNNDTYKWKPVDQLTIDFTFFPAAEEDVDDDDLPRITSKNMHRAFLLGAKDGQDVKLFSARYPVKATLLPDPIDPAGLSVSYAGDVILEDSELTRSWGNSVVECVWDYERGQFSPIRIRDDRIHPNNYDVAVDVWRDIHNPIALSTLTGEDLILMRKLHNRVKETMLTRYLQEGNIIIDIGSGRGGDLTKWRKIGLERVYAIEPNDDNETGYPELARRLAEDQIRYGDKMPDVELLTVGAQETAKIKKRVNDDRIDAIVSFFSMTFFGQSKKMFKGLLDTLSMIPEGGYFIGAVMDGIRVHDLLAKTREWLVMTVDDLNNEADRQHARAQMLMEGDPFGNIVAAGEIDKEAARLHAEAERRGADFEPLDPEEAVEYISDAFSIVQTSIFDMSDPIGNEIEISIDDPTSMVKDQVEWLFNYEIFRTKMAAMGFDELTSSFIDGDEAKFLPKDAYTFSSLNRVFCFQRIPKRSVFIAPTVPGEVKSFSNKYDDNMIIVGARQKNGGFVHGALQALSPKYADMSGPHRDAYVLRIRKSVANKLTMKRFQELHDGELAKRMAYQFGQPTGPDTGSARIGSSKGTTGPDTGSARIGSSESTMKAAFAKFKIRLADPAAIVSETSLLELLSDRLDVAIYVTNPSNDGLAISHYSSNKVHCESILNHDNAIVLATDDGLTFYLVGRKVSRTEHAFVFDRNDVMIQQLHAAICE